MQKMRIVLDENKIEKDKTYDLNEIKKFVKYLFDKRDMPLDDYGWYSNGDFIKCGSLAAVLSEKKWFMDNVLEWLWYDDKYDSVEDLIKHYRRDGYRLYDTHIKTAVCG